MKKELNKFLLVGIDPGESSGFVIYNHISELIVFHQTYTNKNIMFDYINNELDFNLVDNVLIEEFRVYPWANLNFSNLDAVEIIGILKYIIDEDYIIMSKTSTKSFFTDKKIKDLDYPIKDMDKHQKDAFRHILYYYHITLKNQERFKKFIEKMT